MAEDEKAELTKRTELAGCVITDSEDRVLLLHRQTPEKEQWELPGGKIEPGEDPMGAAKREVMEELGVEVKIDGELGRRDFVESNHPMGYVWYNAQIVSGEPAPTETDKHDRLDYFPWESLREMRDLSSNAKNLVAFHFEQLDASP